MLELLAFTNSTQNLIGTFRERFTTIRPSVQPNLSLLLRIIYAFCTFEVLGGACSDCTRILVLNHILFELEVFIYSATIHVYNL